MSQVPLFPPEHVSEEEQEQEQSSDDPENLVGERAELWDGERNWKLLLRAARRNDAAQATALLDAGADPWRNCADEDPLGRNALHVAACFAHKETMAVLLAHPRAAPGAGAGAQEEAGGLADARSQLGCTAPPPPLVLIGHAASLNPY